MDQNNSTPQNKTNSQEQSHMDRNQYRSRIYTSSVNVNPLVAACDQLLNLVVVLKTAELPDDNERLLQDLAHEIRSFEHQAQSAKYDAEIIANARYAICSLLDEIIESTKWGQEKNWSEKNLLSLFHDETYGGDKFYSIIDQAIDNIAINLHLIELLYLCLNLGFTGKYNSDKNDQNELLATTNRLYQIIGRHTHRNPKNIMIDDLRLASPHGYTPPSKAPAIVDTKKIFGTAIIVALIVGGLIYIGVHIKLNTISQPIYAAIEQIQQNKSENSI